MKLKVWFTLALLVVSFLNLTLVVNVGSWHTPCSADDMLYEEFGPRPSQLLIKIYTDYAAELAGFKNKEIDVMDSMLDPIDYMWFETNDPTHEDYSTAFYAEFGVYQYDINCQVLPTSIVSVRQAFAHMLDKQYFINTYLAGIAYSADSVLAGLSDWFNPGVTDLYNLQPRTTMVPFPDDLADWEMAYDLLVADLGPPINDPEDPSYYTWTWPSPFPDPSPNLPLVPDNYLLVIYRYDYPLSEMLAYYFVDCVENVMPEALVMLGKPPTRINVQIFPPGQTLPVCREEVLEYYRYHVFAGGPMVLEEWNPSRDPDFLKYYTTPFITKPEPYGKNYVMYSNLDFDYEVDLMLTSNSPGDPVIPCDGIYHACNAQAIMEGDEPVIPMFGRAGYKAYLSNWEGMVNERGEGINSWWTFMNAHKTGSESCDTLRYGWAGDLVSLNPIGASGFRDYEVLDKIYDTLIKFNPYELTEDRPWMANWELGTWTDGFDTYTKVRFYLREDIWWQDVPWYDRSNIAVGNGGQIDGPFTNMQVTPLDVAFSWVYQRDNTQSPSSSFASIINHVDLNPVWQSMWPYDTELPPWWNLDPEDWQYDYVQWDDTIGNYVLDVYCNAYMPWLAHHWLGGMYVIPMHIWSQIPIDGSEAIDAWAYWIAYGCGPWILLGGTPGVSMTLAPFRSGLAYSGIVLATTYHHGLPVILQGPPQYSVAYNENEFGIDFTTTFVGAGSGLFAHSIEYWFSYDIRKGGVSYSGISPNAFIGPIRWGETRSVTWTLTPIPGGLSGEIKIHVGILWHIVSCWEYNPVTQEYDIPHPGCNFVGLLGCLLEGLETSPSWYSTTITVPSVLVHDVAITGVTVYKTVVGQGYENRIYATVENFGDYDETFDVTAYANKTLIETKIVFLPIGGSTDITFTWDTAGFAFKGVYKISVNATQVPYEVNIDNNNFTNSDVKVTIPGDIDGDFYVDISDATQIGLYWLQLVPPAPANADINGDGVIDIGDATQIGLNWLKDP